MELLSGGLPGDMMLRRKREGSLHRGGVVHPPGGHLGGQRVMPLLEVLGFQQVAV